MHPTSLLWTESGIYVVILKSFLDFIRTMTSSLLSVQNGLVITVQLFCCWKYESCHLKRKPSDSGHEDQPWLWIHCPFSLQNTHISSSSYLRKCLPIPFFLRPEEAVKNLFPSSSRTCCRAVKLHEGCRNICNYFDVPQIAMFWTPFKKTNKAECMYTVISLRDGVKLHFDELASSPYSPPRPLF